MSDEHILTTPPVHDAGPEIGQREIRGGDTAKVGLDSRLRDAFVVVADNLAARNTRTVIAVPVRQLVEATLNVVADLPRVPDYDSVTAQTARWTEVSEYSPSEVSDFDPDNLGVFVHDAGPATGKVCVEFAMPEKGTARMFDFDDPDYAESFFLAGLAACAYARKQQGR